MDRNEDQVKMEFAVQMSCQSCEDEVRSVLNVSGIENVFIDISNELVLVDTTLPSSRVQQLLQETGKLVIFRGIGGVREGISTPLHHGAAVVVMKGNGSVKGLARLVQLSQDRCAIDGTLDGLIPGQSHLVQIHEYGDLSSGCDNCGDVYGVTKDDKPAGYLCSVTPDETGRAVFQTVSNRIKVWDIIGRSMVIHTPKSPIPLTSRLMCGIIARSAGIFQNTKKVCTCDGVTIWDEAQKNRDTS